MKEEITFSKTELLIGKITRIIVIPLIGYVGYFIFKPQTNIFSTSLIYITIGDILRTILVFGIVIYTFMWFFRFPDNEEGYSIWAAVAYGLLGLLIFVIMGLLFYNSYIGQKIF